MRRPPTARQAAHRILLDVETRQGYSGALLRRLPHAMDRRERGLTTELVLGTLRWRGRLDHVLGQCSQRPLDEVDAPLLAALRLGAYQILHLQRVPDSAAVNESVQLVRRRAGRGGGGFVNAVLRALVRARDSDTLRWPAADEPLVERLSVETSHPVWLVRRWLERLGHEEGEQALLVDNRPAPLTLRTNRQRMDRAELRNRLEMEGVHTEVGQWSALALRVTSGQPLDTRAFRDGLFYVQDEASMLVSDILAVRRGERIADLCAAPGGKTTDIASSLAGEGMIVASDVHPQRLCLLEENMKRLRLGALRLVVQDATMPALRAAAFDRVLLDAPCTGTGVLRRHPEIRWRRQLEDVTRMAALQHQLMGAAAELVRPGGALVYSVCSLEPEEGPSVVHRFLEERKDYEPETPPGVPEDLLHRSAEVTHLWTFPHRHDLDGFFAAVLRRRSAP